MENENIEPKTHAKQFHEMTEQEAREELAYWQKKIDAADGWGGAVGAAYGFRDAARRQLIRLGVVP